MLDALFLFLTLGGVSFLLVLAVSFTTNTNWQAYSSDRETVP